MCTCVPGSSFLLFVRLVRFAADVAATFKGIIQAIREVAPAIKAANMKLFIRRGGPNYQQVRLPAAARCILQLQAGRVEVQAGQHVHCHCFPLPAAAMVACECVLND